MLDEADQFAHETLTDELFNDIVSLIPDNWLMWDHTENTPEQIREIYFKFLKNRFQHSDNFLNLAKNARR
jgi:hypothetical protein